MEAPVNGTRQTDAAESRDGWPRGRGPVSQRHPGFAGPIESAAEATRSKPADGDATDPTPQRTQEEGCPSIGATASSCEKQTTPERIEHRLISTLRT